MAKGHIGMASEHIRLIFCASQGQPCAASSEEGGFEWFGHGAWAADVVRGGT